VSRSELDAHIREGIEDRGRKGAGSGSEIEAEPFRRDVPSGGDRRAGTGCRSTSPGASAHASGQTGFCEQRLRLRFVTLRPSEVR
jgi:hypothetical protein